MNSVSAPVNLAGRADLGRTVVVHSVSQAPTPPKTAGGVAGSSSPKRAKVNPHRKTEGDPPKEGRDRRIRRRRWGRDGSNHGPISVEYVLVGKYLQLGRVLCDRSTVQRSQVSGKWSPNC